MCRRRRRARAQSYQRLEFLGDRVLGLVVSEMLYEAFPPASEGDLSVRLARLVRRETCAEVAEDWNVGPHVVMGQGEARGGGRNKAAILGDVCEALIGAVFLDGGFEAARALVRRFWETRMRADAAPDPGRQDRRAGMGAGARARRRRAMSRSSAAGRRICLASSCRWSSKAMRPSAAKPPPSAPPNRPRRKAFLERWATP